MFTPLTNELSKIVTLFTPKIIFHTLRYIIRSDIIRYSKTKLSSHLQLLFSLASMLPSAPPSSTGAAASFNRS